MKEQQRAHARSWMILIVAPWWFCCCCCCQLVILQNLNERASSLAMIPMRAIVPHTRRLMMVKTAHKSSDFSWTYKGWKIFNENTVKKPIKIDFSQHLLDKTQFCKRKPIRDVLVSRIVTACIVIQWVCKCMDLMVKVSVLAIAGFFVILWCDDTCKFETIPGVYRPLYLPLCIQTFEDYCLKVPACAPI